LLAVTTATAQEIPESNAQPFYGVRHFVSMDGQDTLSISYEDERVNFRTTDSIIVHKLDYAAFFSGLYGDTVSYSFPHNDTISLGTGKVRLHDNDTFKGALLEYDLAPKNLYIAPDELTYVVANYNSGNPEYTTTTDVEDISESDVVPVYTVYRQNGNAYVQGWYDLGEGLANKLHQRHVFIQRVERQSGLSIDTLNTLNMQLSAGVVWRGGQQNFLDAFNSLDDSLYFYYYDDANWQYNTTEQLNNTNYQTPTGLATTGNNNYVVNWFFRGIGTGPVMFYVVGTEDYAKLQDAEAAQIPANLPNIIQKFAFPVGRVIIEKGVATVTEINSYFDKAFTAQVVTEHNNLGGLQGGTPGQYYHLTSAQVTKLNGIEEGAEVNVNADWDAVSGDAQILNKPDVIEFSDTVTTIATKYDLDTLNIEAASYTFGNGLTESGGTVELGDPSIPETVELKYEGENTRHFVGTYDNIASPVQRSFMYVEDDKFYAESGDVGAADYSFMEMLPTQTTITTATGTDQTLLRVEPYVIELIADSKVKINNKLNISGQTTYPSGLEGDIIRLNSHSTDPDGLYMHDGTQWNRFLDDSYSSITDWNTAYNHSQITTGNPHNINLADIGESLSSINYWTKTGSDLSYTGGNVGIGIASPNANLDILDNDGGYLRFSSSAATAYEDMGGIEWYQMSGVPGVVAGIDVERGGGAYNQGYMRFLTADGGAATEKMRITSDGKVGIGTTNPRARLELDAALATPNLSTPLDYGCLVVGDGGDVGMIMGTISSPGRYPSYIQSRNFGTSGLAYQLLLNPLGGNVGIGTSSPNTTFHASGKSTFGNAFTPNGNNTENILNLLVGSNSNGLTNGITFYESDNGFGMTLGYDGTRSGDDNKMAFYDNLGGEILAMYNGGNVDIPNGNMTVSGDVTADNFILSSDSTLKENFTPLYNSSEIGSFTFKRDTTKRVRYGVIAQELQKTHPEMVYQSSDSTLGVAYTDYLLHRVAKLQNEINELKQGGTKDENNALPFINLVLIVGAIIYVASTRYRNI